jgi:hypothetical protein
MTRITILILLIFFGITKVTAQKNVLENCPKVDLKIKLSKDTFNIKDDIQIEMLLTNNSKTNQKFLFDKPKSSTGGPAWTWVSLTNVETKKSALKYANKKILESQIYTEEQLKDKYYVIKPGQTLKRKYSLYDLAVTTLESYQLEKGTYELQITYCNSSSNNLIFTIR